MRTGPGRPPLGLGSPMERDKIKRGYITPAFLGAE